MRQWLGWAILSGLAPLACQADERPPPLEAPVSAPPPEEPDSFVDPDDMPSPRPHSLCGAATAQLDFVRPNLYFAIDASGSMTDRIPPGAAAYAPGEVPPNRYVALSTAIRSLLARVGHRVNYGATLFPAGTDSCDAGEEIRALAAGDDVSFAVSGELGPALQAFMFRINRRAPRGATPVTLALRGLLPELEGAGANTYVFLVTDGGPNCNPDVTCGADTCIPNLEQLRVSESIVCDERFNCCDQSAFGAENCLDADGSLAAVQALAAAGVKTFVIGIPGSEAFADVLDQLAVAGGVARLKEPHYYRVGDADELVETVSALGLTVAMSCDIQLTAPPPDPALVNLFFDGEVVPSDPVDGWTFVDEKTVRVQGASCELLETGQVLQAELIAGCPIIIR